MKSAKNNLKRSFMSEDEDSLDDVLEIKRVRKEKSDEEYEEESGQSCDEQSEQSGDEESENQEEEEEDENLSEQDSEENNSEEEEASQSEDLSDCEEENHSDDDFWQYYPISLNFEQKEPFDYVCKLLSNSQFRRTNPTSVCIQGPAGAGKTEILKCLKDYAEKDLLKTAIFTASTGVAASNHSEGKTAHSIFGYPFKISNPNTQLSNINEWNEDEVRNASLIVYDEVNMVDKLLIEMLDRTLQSMMKSNKLFGGKVVVFAGDFRQTSPVVGGVFDTAEIDTSLKSSSIWEQTKKFILTKNMRSKEDPGFATFLNQLSSGRLRSVKLEHNVFKRYVPLTGIQYTTDVNAFIETTYPEKILANPDESARRAILVSEGETAKCVNKYILKSVDGDVHTLSAEITYKTGPIEFKGNFYIDRVVPDQKIKLKNGCVCLLTSNVYSPTKLLAGTRIIVDEVSPEGVYVRKPGKRTCYLLERKSFKTWNFNQHVTFNQYPLELGYAMTIHKSQGLTLDKVGIHLQGQRKHGMLYMALSRARSRNDVSVLVREEEVLSGTAYAENTVYQELV